VNEDIPALYASVAKHILIFDWKMSTKWRRDEKNSGPNQIALFIILIVRTFHLDVTEKNWVII
jgi:hypothetical protein